MRTIIARWCWIFSGCVLAGVILAGEGVLLANPASGVCVLFIGAGVLVDTVFAVDVAWMSGSFERSASEYDYRESVDDSALVIEAAYRF